MIEYINEQVLPLSNGFPEEVLILQWTAYAFELVSELDVKTKVPAPRAASISNSMFAPCGLHNRSFRITVALDLPPAVANHSVTIVFS